ncbi:unnamed protein product [Laminaria digitata]
MEEKAVDVLRLVALSGVVRPSEIELVCLAACNACRESSADYSVVVKANNMRTVVKPTTPRAALAPARAAPAPAPAPAAGPKPSEPAACENTSSSSSSISSSSSSSAKAVSLTTTTVATTNTTTTTTTTPRVTPHRRISRLAFHLDLRLSLVTWPEGLLILRFGWPFDDPLECPLPTSLLEVDLGGTFNHHVEDVSWPPRLTKLRFGDRFNRPVELATWPATLKSLKFGSSFDQPIGSMEWPPALESLSLGDAFNHPVQATAWAGTRLKRLDFGMAFRQAIEEVDWPPGLEELRFGACFDQALDARQLPRGLQLLQVPDLYLWDDHTFQMPGGLMQGGLPEGLPEGCELCVETVVLCDQDLIAF